jgi:hypothetical protein
LLACLFIFIFLHAMAEKDNMMQRWKLLGSVILAELLFVVIAFFLSRFAGILGLIVCLGYFLGYYLGAILASVVILYLGNILLFAWTAKQHDGSVVQNQDWICVKTGVYMSPFLLVGCLIHVHRSMHTGTLYLLVPGLLLDVALIVVGSWRLVQRRRWLAKVSAGLIPGWYLKNAADCEPTQCLPPVRILVDDNSINHIRYLYHEPTGVPQHGKRYRANCTLPENPRVVAVVESS